MNVACALCDAPLTDRQRAEGNKFCSRSCAYEAFKGIPHQAEKRDYKRKQALGGVRPIAVPRDDLGFPTTKPVHLGAGEFLAGPLRLAWITLRHYHDGRIEVRCPVCFRPAEAAWCKNCGVTIQVDPPKPKPAKKPKPERLPKACPVCNTMHLRPVYCSPACCRLENERRKTESRRKPPRTACPQGHPYTPENRRTKKRMRNGVLRIETDCRACR